MEYNTQRKKTIIPEYGRYIQEMIDFTKTIQDREKRNLAAKTIIRQMAFFQNQPIKESTDLDRKLWDQLHIISNFELDIDAPYPKPDFKALNISSKPKYNSQNKDLSFRYYGKIVEDMIQSAVLMEDGEEKNAFVRDIANNMKKLFIAWNKGNVDDEIIFNHLSEISLGKLTLSDSTELSSNFTFHSTSQNYKQFKKKKTNKDFKSNYSNGQKKYYPKKKQ